MNYRTLIRQVPDVHACRDCGCSEFVTTPECDVVCTGCALVDARDDFVFDMLPYVDARPASKRPRTDYDSARLITNIKRGKFQDARSDPNNPHFAANKSIRDAASKFGFSENVMDLAKRIYNDFFEFERVKGNNAVALQCLSLSFAAKACNGTMSYTEADICAPFAHGSDLVTNLTSVRNKLERFLTSKQYYRDMVDATVEINSLATQFINCFVSGIELTPQHGAPPTALAVRAIRAKASALVQPKTPFSCAVASKANKTKAMAAVYVVVYNSGHRLKHDAFYSVLAKSCEFSKKLATAPLTWNSVASTVLSGFLVA
jgi:transcription initiation factor TFIIIB Brf1 subunit/transcription initiation factor TFIIB